VLCFKLRQQEFKYFQSSLPINDAGVFRDLALQNVGAFKCRRFPSAGFPGMIWVIAFQRREPSGFFGHSSHSKEFSGIHLDE
jgi:hypothetical protein